jgi:hypothetical protein
MLALLDDTAEAEPDTNFPFRYGLETSGVAGELEQTCAFTLHNRPYLRWGS